MRSTDSLYGDQIRESLRGRPATEFLTEGHYGTFVADFLMRPFQPSVHTPAPARDDRAGPSRAPADEPTAENDDISWSIRLPDIYGREVTHHFSPPPESGSSSRASEVSASYAVNLISIHIASVSIS